MTTPKTPKVLCAMCLEHVQASTITKAGVCIYCEDVRADAREEHQKKAVARDNEKNAQAKLMFAKNKRLVVTHKEQAEKIVKDKQLTEAAKRINEVNREQASIALARRSVLHYIERRKPEYKVNWYIEDVARRIEKFYDDVINERSPRLILACPSRHGKQIMDDTDVFTANRGWTTHGELKVGDFVFGSDGFPTRVEAVAAPIPCDMEIEFTDGSIFGTHSNHEWLVKHTRNIGDYVVKSTKDIMGLQLRKAGYAKNYNWRLPDKPRLFFPHAEQPMDPYMLGLHLADGTRGGNRITHHAEDTHHIAECERRGYSVQHRSADKTTMCVYSFMSGRAGAKFISELRAAGVYHKKIIPDTYRYASVQQRVDFLAGIYDGDGSVDSTGRMVFTNTNKELIDGVVEILRSLGESPGVVLRPAKTYTRVRNGKTFVTTEVDSWSVQLYPRYKDYWMATPRKYDNLRRRWGRDNNTSGATYIVRAEKKSGLGLGRCIQVAAKDGMYLVGKNLIPTHNSELASDSGVAWALGNWPQLSIVVASYSDDLPTKFSKSIRAQLQSEEFHKVFPNGARISKTDAAAGAWLTTQGGGLKAVGCGGGLLGFGANALILDDIIRSAEDADNPATLENAYDWMTSTAMSRLAPGGGILLIMQRLAPMDPVGRLHANQKEEERSLEQMYEDIKELERKSSLAEDEVLELRSLKKEAAELDESMDRYHTVIYPALAVQEEYLTPEGEIVRIADQREVQDGWELLRRPGDALHPERYSRNALLKLQRANYARFQSMYMLDPIAESGEYFTVDDFKRYESGKYPKLQHLHVYTAWDLAISTKTHADYTCGIAGGTDHKGNLWMFEIVHGRFGSLDLVADLVIDLHVRWGANLTGIEKTGLELALGPTLRQHMLDRREFIALAEGQSALRPIADKRVRARTLQALCRQGKVYVPQGDMWDSFISQATQFPIGQHDDMVDSASWLAIMASRDSLPRDPAGTKDIVTRIKDAYDSWFGPEAEDSIITYMDS